MSDHVDTIRHFIATDVDYRAGAYERRNAARAALDALLAERQQLIDALRLIVHEGGMINAAVVARAALVQVGEKP